MSTWTFMNIKVQGHSDSTFSNFFSWETARPIEARLVVDPSWDRGTKVCSNGPGHMTKMATVLVSDENIVTNDYFHLWLSTLVFIFSLWQLHQRVDSGSMVRALDFCPGDQDSNPTRVVKFSAMLYSFVTAPSLDYLGLYSISDNCIRESTLWLSG